MKLSKKIGGITALLLAAIGAFAVTTHQRSNIYFYQSGSGGCKPVDVEFSCNVGGTGCTAVIGTGVQPKQLYHSQLNIAVCRTPLMAS